MRFSIGSIITYVIMYVLFTKPPLLHRDILILMYLVIKYTIAINSSKIVTG